MKRWAFAAIYLTLALAALAGFIGLKWDPSTTPGDGGYYIYAGTNPGSYIVRADVGPVLTARLKTPSEITNLLWFFSATRYLSGTNEDGTAYRTESDFSNEVTNQFPYPPTNFGLTIVRSINLTNWQPVEFFKLEFTPP